nr:vegetative cell wall protein gp1-like [Aegilops tauschii subsp. strangulata]
MEPSPSSSPRPAAQSPTPRGEAPLPPPRSPGTCPPRSPVASLVPRRYPVHRASSARRLAAPCLRCWPRPGLPQPSPLRPSSPAPPAALARKPSHARRPPNGHTPRRWPLPCSTLRHHPRARSKPRPALASAALSPRAWLCPTSVVVALPADAPASPSHSRRCPPTPTALPSARSPPPAPPAASPWTTRSGARHMRLHHRGEAAVAQRPRPLSGAR